MLYEIDAGDLVDFARRWAALGDAVADKVAQVVDVFTVQRLAGHADALTTARYDRRGEGERRRAAAQLRIPSL